MKTLALEFLCPPDYAAELVDRAQDILSPSLEQLGLKTFKALKRHLHKHHSEQSAIMLAGVETPLSYEGQQLLALFAMKYCRGDSHPQFTCFVGTVDKITAERDRIVGEIQTESIARKLTTTIATFE